MDKNALTKKKEITFFTIFNICKNNMVFITQEIFKELHLLNLV